MNTHTSHAHKKDTCKAGRRADTPPELPGHEEQNTEHGTPHHHKHGFRGYTLEELKYRNAVTRLKIELTTERLRLYCNPRLKEEVQTVSGYVRGVESVMRYVDYAILAFNITRKIRNFMGHFSRSKN